MQARFVQEGRALLFTPASAVTANTVQVLGDHLVGVALAAIAAGVEGALTVAGVFDFAKDSSDISEGDALYWDADGNPVGGTAGSGAMSSDPTKGPFAGWALEDAGVSAGNVKAFLRSLNDTDAEGISLGDLDDVDDGTPTNGQFLVADGTHWQSTDAFSVMPKIPVAAVAAAGSTQADAGALATGFSLVSDANGTKGVKLPAAAAGAVCIVKNNANAVLKLYPGSSDAINALSADAALSMAAFTSALLVAYDATTWYTVPLLPS